MFLGSYDFLALLRCPDSGAVDGKTQRRAAWSHPECVWSDAGCSPWLGTCLQIMRLGLRTAASNQPDYLPLLGL